MNELIFQSGRPLLIFSGGMADRLPSSFDHAAIAWDHSQQATRAVADAMWLLQSVKTVRVFTATDNETPAERESGEALIKHLGAHGIKAQFEIIPKGTASTGKIFEAYVKNHAIDLFVMGAYRHSRLRGPGWCRWRAPRPGSTAIRMSCGRRGFWHVTHANTARRRG